MNESSSATTQWYINYVMNDFEEKETVNLTIQGLYNQADDPKKTKEEEAGG